MGYQVVKLTETTAENTLWYCRYCGGGMAVGEIKSIGNHAAGEEKGDAVFNEAKTADPLKAIVKMKLSETHHIEFTKHVIEADIDPQGGGEPEVLSAIFSDVSGQKYEASVPVLKPLEGVHMFYSLHKWKMADRTWVDYPSEVMGPLTTLEETKPSTCIIIVKQYCTALQTTHSSKAKLLQRWKDQEMWTIDKDTLNAFVEELKNGAGEAAPAAEVDLGAAGGGNASPTC